MGIRKALCVAAVGSTLVMWGAAASADEQAAPGARVVVLNEGLRLPVRYVDRGITNPAGILTPELDLDISRFGLEVPGVGGANPDAIGTMGISSGYSVTDDFGLRATVFVLQFNDPFRLAAGALGATYRLIKGDFELGLALDWIYQANDFNPGQDIVPSMPMHIHFGHVVRLDITPALPISTAGIYIPALDTAFGGGKTTVGLAVPLELLIQPIEQLHLGIGTGFSMTFNPGSAVDGVTFGDTFLIPLEFEVGVSIPGPHGPVLDMTPFFVFPGLFVPGIQNGPSPVQSGVWEGGVKFTTFFYL